MIVLRDTLNPKLTQLGAAHPAQELTATRQLNRIMASAARRMGDRAGLYMAPPGNQPLRQQIVRHAVDAGCTLDADEIVITSPAAEKRFPAACRLSAAPATPLRWNRPSVSTCFNTWKTSASRPWRFPRTPGTASAWKRCASPWKTIPYRPAASFPTSTIRWEAAFRTSTRKVLVGMLAARDIPLIENDIFGDIHFSAKRPLSAKAYDTKGLVLWCASFSKTLSPGLRVGWAAPGRFRSTVAWLKYSTSLAAATLPQVAVAEFMADGGYRQHLQTDPPVVSRPCRGTETGGHPVFSVRHPRNRPVRGLSALD
jgi:DNA-binding transcriptional MocR family regulator